MKSSGIPQRPDALVIEHLPQVRRIARKIHRSLPRYISFDDLVSMGVTGLIAAVDNLDHLRNGRFEAYAEYKIRGAILDGLREDAWRSRATDKQSKAVGVAIHFARQLFGREPDDEEIAAQIGISLETYHTWVLQIHRSERCCCLNPLNAYSDSYSLLDFISDDKTNWPSHIAERREFAGIIISAINRMPRNQRDVLSLYYYQELNLRQIGDLMGLRQSRVSQLRIQAIIRLQSHLKGVLSGLPHAPHRLGGADICPALGNASRISS